MTCTSCLIRLIVLVLLPVCCMRAGRAGPLPVVSPEKVGLSGQHLAWIDEAVKQALEEGRMPGCVIAIGRHGKLGWLKAYGDRRVKPAAEPMSVDTLFDMASLTKPVATATSVMILLERGRIRLSDTVTQHLPEFAGQGKDQITIEQLLTHQSGLVADNALEDYEGGADAAWQRICQLALAEPPGTRFIYSDVGYMVLGKLVERLSGQTLDRFARDNIFAPLDMNETGYLPDESLLLRAAPTEERDGQWVQGQVHDPRAYRLGGVAGHAGLFSTAQDLAVYAQTMLQEGTYDDVRILSPATVRRMTRRHAVSSGFRGLGWDIQTGYSKNKSDLFSDRAYGHGGFTGTVLWIDPELDLFVIFLSNRVHPDGKGEVNTLAARIGSIAAAAVVPDRAVINTDSDDCCTVLTGLDVLVRDGFRQLKGRRVGLITNQTGIDRTGRSNIELFAQAPDVTLVALFSPEHGLQGQMERASIDDSREEVTGLPVYSLYGATRQPTATQLAGIDTLVFDIQDMGTRFYTYISTMGLAMKAAAEHRLRFVVLDRPNPINGVDVSGPVLDRGQESFVGFHTLPVRHGMTAGELAGMFRAELGLDLDLEVVPMAAWQRPAYFDQTGLIWVNPSPNIRNLNQALLYPGIGLLETTNMSVGRGTDTPFEVIGAPWLDGRQLAGKLHGLGLAGVTFVPCRFTPSASTHAGATCQGVQILVTDRQRVDPVRVGLAIATALRQLHPHEWRWAPYGRLLGNEKVLAAVEKGTPVEQLEPLYADELAAFFPRRARYLLYSD